MFYCSSCGRELNDKMAFCPSCGKKLKEKETPVVENEVISEEPVWQEAPSTESVTAPVKETKSNEKEPEKKKKRTVPLIILLFLLALIPAYFFLIKPRLTPEAEVVEISMNNASGYWVSKEDVEVTDEGKMFDSSNAAVSFYIDDSLLVVSKDGEDIVDIYQVTAHSVDREKNELEIAIMDEEQSEMSATFTVSSKDASIVLFEIADEEPVEVISVTEEEYVNAGGSELSKETFTVLVNTEEVVEVEEVEEPIFEELTLADVVGYYVDRGVTGQIDYIFKLTEENTSNLMFHSEEYYPVAYSGSRIEHVTVNGNVFEMDHVAVDHNSMRYNEYHEYTQALEFQMEDGKPVSYKFYDADLDSVYEYMTLEQIYAELNGLIDMDLDAFLTRMYEETLLEILEDTGYDNSNSVAELVLDGDPPTIWGTYVYEEEDSDGYTVSTFLEFKEISKVDSVLTPDGEEMMGEELKEQGINGLWNTWVESDNPAGGLGGAKLPTYIRDVEFFEVDNSFTVYLMYELGDEPDPRHYHLVGTDTISLENQDRQFKLVE